MPPPPPPVPPLPSPTLPQPVRSRHQDEGTYKKCELQAALSEASQHLKKTSTLVTTADGRLIRESRDAQGIMNREVLSSSGLGFIGDVKPDLQVGEVLPGLIMGSQDLAVDRQILSKYGVTHILNLASYVEDAYPGLYTYKRLQILDLPNTNIIEHFPECFEFIEKGRQKGCVLVHCNAGVSRSATVVIAYLMKTEKMNFVDAFSFLKDKRPSIRPNEGFMKQLKDYSRVLFD